MQTTTLFIVSLAIALTGALTMTFLADSLHQEELFTSCTNTQTRERAPCSSIDNSAQPLDPHPAAGSHSKS